MAERMGVGVEIERKYRVRGAPWEGLVGRPMVQGYLASQDGVAVRVRRAGDQAWLTVKGPARGAVRAEFEWSIPVDEAEGLLALCGDRLVRKTRYHPVVGDHTWDLDVFEGRNAGLVVAEVELDAADAPFVRPTWLGDEVTHDPRYANARLAEAPFDTWEGA